MQIIFMGTPDFAVQSLKALAEAGHVISAVVTVPDKAQGRGLKVKPSPVKDYALSKNFPVLQPQSLKDSAFIDQLDNYSADCFVIVAFRILPKEVFSLPRLGTINVHASLLPAYRGAAPINWAIINGETRSGVTTMFIDARVDTGDILMQEEVAVSPDMTAGELHDILAVKGAGLLIRTLQKIENNEITPLVQDESLATKAPKLSNDNCLIDFNKPVADVRNLIRGLSPHPAAFSWFRGKKIKIFRAAEDSGAVDKAPGTIVNITADSFSVSCLDGAIKILEVRMEGKRRMTARDFLNGNQLKKGEIFDNRGQQLPS